MATPIIQLWTQTACDSAVLKDGKVTTYTVDDGVTLVLTPRADGTHTTSYVHRYRFRGERFKVGLGSHPEVSLAEAKLRAQENRRSIAAGKNPKEVKRERRRREIEQREDEAADKNATFNELIDLWLASAARPNWKPGNRGQVEYEDCWKRELHKYVSPVFGNRDVRDINRALVRKAFDPIWKTRHATAYRCLGRVRKLLDWASENGYRPENSDNPARTAHHKASLPWRKVLGIKKKHFAAIDFNDLPAFLAVLRTQEGNCYRF
jgi:hypothetical protein